VVLRGHVRRLCVPVRRGTAKIGVVLMASARGECCRSVTTLMTVINRDGGDVSRRIRVASPRSRRPTNGLERLFARNRIGCRVRSNEAPGNDHRGGWTAAAICGCGAARERRPTDGRCPLFRSVGRLTTSR